MALHPSLVGPPVAPAQSPGPALSLPCPADGPGAGAAMCPANPPRGAETHVGPLAQGARLAARARGLCPLKVTRHCCPDIEWLVNPLRARKQDSCLKKLHLPATRSIHTLLYRVCGSGLCVDERRISAVAHAAMLSEPCSRPPVSASLDEHAGTTRCLFPPATRCPRKPETHRLCFYNNDYKRIKFAKHRIKNSSSLEHLI